jgi:hypothetical protein
LYKTGGQIRVQLNIQIPTWAYGKEKIRGAERNLPDFFGLCPSRQKNFSGEIFPPKLLSTGGGRSDYEKFLLDSIFPTKLTEFPTKLTEFVQFIVKRINYEANIARLALFAQQTAGAAAPLAPPPGTPMNSHVNKSKREKHNGPSRLPLQIRSSNELNQINCILRGYEYTTQYFIR